VVTHSIGSMIEDGEGVATTYGDAVARGWCGSLNRKVVFRRMLDAVTVLWMGWLI
jgi:hypothetical protein